MMEKWMEIKPEKLSRTAQYNVNNDMYIKQTVQHYNRYLCVLRECFTFALLSSSRTHSVRRSVCLSVALCCHFFCVCFIHRRQNIKSTLILRIHWRQLHDWGKTHARTHAQFERYKLNGLSPQNRIDIGIEIPLPKCTNVCLYLPHFVLLGFLLLLFSTLSFVPPF